MDGEIGPDELRSLLASDDPPRIVDVRSPTAFATGHIPGSENVPFGELPSSAPSFAGADRVVTVCPHGEASVQAARLIGAAAGVDGRVESMRGGLTAWDGEMETDESRGENGPEPGPDAPF